MNPDDITLLVENQSDHLQFVDVNAMIVRGPSFKTRPITLVAKIRHEESRLEYFQLFKMRPRVAAALRDQLIDTIDKFDDLENT